MKRYGTMSGTRKNGIDTSGPRTTILQLNDDCLMLIFDRLELLDKIALKQTCTRFEEVARVCFRRYRSYEVDVGQAPCEEVVLNAQAILSEVGPFLERLSILEDKNWSILGNTFVEPTVSELIMNLLPQYCPKLRELKIWGTVVMPEAFKGLEKIVEVLEELTISNCEISEKDITFCLKHAKRLKRLDFSFNVAFTGISLLSLGVTNLKHLNLEHTDILSAPFLAFANNNKRLEYLNIKSCYNLSPRSFEFIVTNMNTLSHLVCSEHFANLTQIVNLPKLKTLQIRIDGKSMDALKGLAQANKLEQLDLSGSSSIRIDYGMIGAMTNLKHLKLNDIADFDDRQLAQLCINGNFVELHMAGCKRISGRQIIEFIGTNPLLKLLDVSFLQITNQILFSTIDILKGRGAIGIPLKMIVGYTRVEPIVLKNELIKNNRDLLDISFGSSRDCNHFNGLQPIEVEDE